MEQQFKVGTKVSGKVPTRNDFTEGVVTRIFRAEIWHAPTTFAQPIRSMADWAEVEIEGSLFRTPLYLLRNEETGTDMGGGADKA